MLDLTPELRLLALSTVVLLALVLLQAVSATKEMGTRWNVGPRDGVDDRPRGVFAGRAQRALDNFKETYPAFIALALLLAATGRAGGIGEAGATTWLIARVLHAPLYLLGAPYLRSLAWLASIIGLAMMFVRLLN